MDPSQITHAGTLFLQQTRPIHGQSPWALVDSKTLKSSRQIWKLTFADNHNGHIMLISGHMSCDSEAATSGLHTLHIVIESSDHYTTLSYIYVLILHERARSGNASCAAGRTAAVFREWRKIHGNRQRKRSGDSWAQNRLLTDPRTKLRKRFQRQKGNNRGRWSHKIL